MLDRGDASNGAADWAVLHKVGWSAILNSTCREEQLYQAVVELGKREVCSPLSLLLGSFPNGLLLYYSAFKFCQ